MIFGVSQINWDDSPWKQLSLVNDKEVISLSNAKVYVFSDSVLCFGKMNENPQSYFLGRQVDVVQKFITMHSFGHNWWWAIGIRVEYFPRIRYVAALRQSQKFTVKIECRTWKIHWTDHLHVGVQRHLMLVSKDNEEECELSAKLVSIYATRFSPGRWSFLGPGSEKKWYSTCDSKPHGEWDRVAELMMIRIGVSGHPVFRATSPLSRGTHKCKGGGKLSIHFCADGGTIETVCSTIISVDQLSIYGAVSDLCEEYKASHVRTVRPVFEGTPKLGPC